MRSDKYRKKHTGRTVLIVLLALVLIGAGALAGAYFGYKGYNKALDASSEEIIDFEVPRGTTTTGLSQKLEDCGIIKSALTFKIKAKLCKLDGKFQAGYYYLSPSMTMDEIMETLQLGKSPETKVTVPEGLTLVQLAEKLVYEGVLHSAEDFYTALEDDYDYWFLEDLGETYADPTGKISAKGNRLEGFLFPETYYIPNDSTAHDIINIMLKQFSKVFTEDMYEDIPEGYTLRDMVIIASIAEFESSYDMEEAPYVARVIYNRLNKKMNIQCDTTVIYALNLYGGDGTVLNKDIINSYDSPYSTYGKTFKGLPAGPICSPGEGALRGAVYPDTSEESKNYLYFCVASDGSNKLLFCDTYEEHQVNSKNYKEYLKSIKQ